jgi:hypothetical protein
MEIKSITLDSAQLGTVLSQVEIAQNRLIRYDARDTVTMFSFWEVVADI